MLEVADPAHPSFITQPRATQPPIHHPSSHPSFVPLSPPTRPLPLPTDLPEGGQGGSSAVLTGPTLYSVLSHDVHGLPDHEPPAYHHSTGLLLRMENLHAPTVPSGPSSRPITNGNAAHLSFAELSQKKENMEAELKALGGVLESVGAHAPSSSQSCSRHG